MVICVEMLLFQRLVRLVRDSAGCLCAGEVMYLVITEPSCDWRVVVMDDITLETIISTGPSHETV